MKASLLCHLFHTAGCLLALARPHFTLGFSLLIPWSRRTPITTTTGLFLQRREVLSRGVKAALVVTTTTFADDDYSARAADDLFRKNPLTNPLLEQVRIWEQAEADELKYGGELTPGSAGNRGRTEAYVRLLVPILEIDQELTTVQKIVLTDDRSQWKKAQAILAQPKYDKIAFKKTFNAFGDNIYYSDPDRANLYLGGGATPKAEQSLAYLRRNEVLTAIEDLRAELDYLLQHPEETAEELRTYSATAQSAMKGYLEIVPPDEIERARKLLASS